LLTLKPTNTKETERNKVTPEQQLTQLFKLKKTARFSTANVQLK
jgi:hypothetical protein